MPDITPGEVQASPMLNEAVPAATGAAEGTSAKEDVGVDLPSGKALTPDGATQITREAVTRVVVVAGAAESGKTTLLASIYETFLRGSFAGYSFAGSATLPAFEERCHLGRVASERVRPETERTKRDREWRFLHLKVRKIGNMLPSQDLLLADLPGEVFDGMMDSTEACQSEVLLKRVDHFVLLVDGAKLADRDMRSVVFANAELLLRSCADAAMLGRHSHVHIVVSKDDALAKAARSPEDAELRSFCEAKLARLQSIFHPRFARVKCAFVAARPASDSAVSESYGLDSMLDDWVSIPGTFCHQPASSSCCLRSTREYDRYLERRMNKRASETLQ